MSHRGLVFNRSMSRPHIMVTASPILREQLCQRRDDLIIGSGHGATASSLYLLGPLVIGLDSLTTPCRNKWGGRVWATPSSLPMVPEMSALLATPLPGLISQPATGKAELLIISPALPLSRLE